MADKEYGFDTLKIQAGYDSADNKYSVSPPIYHTAAFDFRDTEHAENLFTYKEAGYLYTRLQIEVVGRKPPPVIHNLPKVIHPSLHMKHILLWYP